MKKLITLFTAFGLAAAAGASVHTITVANYSFTPQVTNAQCGDTIKWVWSNGTHTTTSTFIPGCAQAWNAYINSGSTTYSYQVTCAGTYYYYCLYDSMMTGQIVVNCSSGIGEMAQQPASLLYPNPFSSSVTITYSNAEEVRFTNALGEVMKKVKLDKGADHMEIDLADLPSGIYFYTALKEGAVSVTRKVIRR